MKKTISWLTVLLIISVAALSLAFFEKNTQKTEETKTGAPQKVSAEESKNPLPGRMFGAGPMGAAPSPKALESILIQQALRDKTMIATSDGGIVVAIGSKLVKYDKDLKVVKEAEIKVDTDAIRESIASRVPAYSTLPPRTANSRLPLAKAFPASSTGAQQDQAQAEQKASS